MSSVAVGRIIEYEVPKYYTDPPGQVFEGGRALQISGQTHRNDLNGKFVVSLGRRDGMRTLVMTRIGDTLSVADHQLSAIEEVGAGTRVTLVGLENENSELNGRIAFIESVAAENVVRIPSLDSNGEEEMRTVKPINFVVTPEGSEDPLPIQPLASVKKRRLIANLVSTAATNSEPPLVGSSSLLSNQPVSGATARLIAIDASVALSNQQPILKRCGTLRKLVHGFPGFAQLVVCLIVKLHLDPTHPGRTLDPSDVPDAMKIAHLLTDGKLDGIPKKDIIMHQQVSLETLLRIADRYCGATHLVFAIDSNFAGIKDSIAAMVHQITGGPSYLIDPPTTTTTINNINNIANVIPMDKAMTSLMANRYASVKPAPPDPMDTE